VTIKEPGPGGMRLIDVPLDMSFAEALGPEGADVPDAYERLIMDVIRGNQTLFMRGDEVEAAWAWTDPIIEGWRRAATGPSPTNRQFRAGGGADAAAPGRAALAGDWLMNLIEYPDRDLMMLDLADTLASELADCLRRMNQRRRFRVPGGTTPGPVFDVLSEQRSTGTGCVVLNDERWVPEDSPRSNTRLLRSGC
jgi:hypothetical protein